MRERETFIISAMRTPIGSFQGMLADVPAFKLGGTVIKGALTQADVQPHQVQECIMGQVLTAGVGQAPARQAALFGGIPDSVGCWGVNKVCGSSLQAVILAHKDIELGLDVVVAGGQESMSQSPYLLPKARRGLRMGHGQVTDSMIYDGLWDPYNDQHMGQLGEICAEDRDYTREIQDEYAIESYRRARDAQQKELFDYEIVGVSMEKPQKTVLVRRDEEPDKVQFDKIPKLKPAFKKEGTITAANASKISDGASALVLMSGDLAKKQSRKPLAKIVSYACVALAPKWFTVTPARAIQKALDKANLKVSDIDLWEINEAFAVVAMAARDDLQISKDRLNIHGGSIALGHPIGASGSRILTTLVHAMDRERVKRGCVAICIGGGEGLALIVERVT